MEKETSPLRMEGTTKASFIRINLKERESMNQVMERYTQEAFLEGSDMDKVN